MDFWYTVYLMRVLTPIQTVYLPEATLTSLRSLIVAGSLKPNERLVEREIADQLGVSRTPVREALFQLQREGLVSDRDGRGLEVSGLSKEEITEIYEALAALERAALLHTPGVSQEMLARLHKASVKRKAAARSIDRIITADIEWHRALTDFTLNTRVRRISGELRTLAERYERAFFAHRENTESTTTEHDEIDRLLDQGKLAEAADKIEKHWLGNIEPMLAAVAEASSERVAISASERKTKGATGPSRKKEA
jgi:DNA-binding GntR family transcriptional regulator